MDVSKNNLEQAIAALRLSRGGHPACCNLEADVDALIAALDAARGQAVAWRVWRGDSYELFFNEDAAKRRCQCFVQQRSPEPLYAAPPAAAVPAGYSLRDYFAAKAMQGMLAAAEPYNTGELARYAYEVADAMLAAERKGEG